VIRDKLMGSGRYCTRFGGEVTRSSRAPDETEALAYDREDLSRNGRADRAAEHFRKTVVEKRADEMPVVMVAHRRYGSSTILARRSSFGLGRRRLVAQGAVTRRAPRRHRRDAKMT